MFPENITLKEVIEACHEYKQEYRILESKGFTFFKGKFNRILNEDQTDRKYQLLKECNGIVFDQNTGKCVARRAHKIFFEESMNKFLVKEIKGGVSISPLLVNDQILYWNYSFETEKTSLSNLYKFIQNSKEHQYEKFCREMLKLNYTPTFEYCDPEDTQTNLHEKYSFHLAYVRHIDTGNYMNEDELCKVSKMYNIPLIKKWINPPSEAQKLLEKILFSRRIEGCIIFFEDGAILKIRSHFNYFYSNLSPNLTNQRLLLISICFDYHLNEIYTILNFSNEKKISLTQWKEYAIEKIIEKAKNMDKLDQNNEFDKSLLKDMEKNKDLSKLEILKKNIYKICYDRSIYLGKKNEFHQWLCLRDDPVLNTIEFDEFKFNTKDLVFYNQFETSYKGMNVKTGEFVLIKKLNLTDYILREITDYSKTSHPNIVKYYHHKVVDNNIYVVQEFLANGSLVNIINNLEPSEELISSYVLQALSALNYLHEHNIIYGCISPFRLGVTNNGSIKLMDWTTLNYKMDKIDENSDIVPYWVLEKDMKKKLTKELDLWFFGCAIIQLFTKESPLIKDTIHPPQITLSVSELCRDFITKCFEKKYQASELMNHPWFEQKRNNHYSKNEELIGDFEIIKKVGQGSQAKIYSCKKIKSNIITALKIFEAEDLKTANIALKEFNILLHCDHEHIIKYYEAFLHTIGDELFVCISMPLCNGPFTHLIQKGLTEQEIIYYSIQILKGVQYLHKNDIIHRDLKPDNILYQNVDQSNFSHLYITDFGLSTFSSSNNSKRTLCGTPNFCAPEIMKGITNYDVSVDVFSLGCLFYSMMTKKENPLYLDIIEDETEALDSIKVEILGIKKYSVKLIDILSKMLRKKPKDRITIDHLLLLFEELAIENQLKISFI